MEEGEMKKNMGKINKWVRIILGIAIILAGIYYGNWWGLIGLIPLLIGISGWCPLYHLFGINTCCQIKK